MGEEPYSWEMSEWAETNQQGVATFYLDGKRWGANPVFVEVGYNGYGSFTPAKSTVTIQGSTGSAQIITRSPNYTLSGIVKDETGAAITSTMLCLFYSNPTNQKLIEVDFTTDANGAYSIPNVGSRWINFQPHECGYVDELGSNYDYQNWYEVLEADQSSFEVQFMKTGIQVTVVDDLGRPAAFVQLGLESQSPDEYDYRRQAVTDAQGVAVFTSLEPNTSYEVSFKNEDRPWDAMRFQDKVNPEPVVTGATRNTMTLTTLSLERVSGFPETPVTVSGKLLGQGNAPIANGTVQVNISFGPGLSSYLGFRVRTDANGNFSVANLPHGQIWLEVSAKGHRSIQKNFATSPSKGTTYDQGNFRLRPSAAGTLEYSGVLKDSTGRPIPNMELVLNNPFESGRGVHREETDSEGRFAFTGLSEGHHWMYANSNWEDYDWGQWGFHLTTNRTNVTLVLFARGLTNSSPQASISGRVLEYKDFEGRDSAIPVPDVCVQVFPVEGGTVSTGTTDSLGNWTATGLMEGEEYFIATPTECSGDQTTQPRFDFQNKYEYPSQNSNTVVARVQGGVPHEWILKEVSDSGPGSISGRVKDAETYSNLAEVTISIERQGGGIVLDSVITDSRGEYQFADLPAGEYYLYTSETSIGDSDYWDSWLSVEVTSEPNRANILLYKKDSSESSGGWLGSLVGKVFDENGDPHGSAGVEVYQPDGLYYVGFGETDNEGNFEISSLPTDTPLFLKIIPWWAEIAMHFIDDIVIDASNSKDVGNINLVPGTSIVGEVSDIPQGVGIQNIYAELVDAESGTFINAYEVDKVSGRYTITQVPPGEYKVRFTQNSRGMVWSQYVPDSISMKPVYWDGTELGTTDITQAGEITVQAGVVVQSKNVTFSPGSVLQGSVSIATANGSIPLTGSRSIWADLLTQDENGTWYYHSYSQVSAESNYSFQFVGLAEGVYKIQFYDSRTGNNALTSNFNGGAANLEDAPEIIVGDNQRVVANHSMSIAPPEKSAEAFDLDDLGAERLAELKDEISFAESAVTGSDLEIFVGTEFAGEFVSSFANSTPVVLGNWQQVNSDGFVTVKIPTTLSAGVHRIAAQDSRGVVFGWAPITITAPAAVVAQPAATKAKPKTSIAVVEAEPEETEGKAAPTEEAASAVPTAADSSGDWLLPLAGGFLLLLAAGSAWVMRAQRVGVRRK
jgi:protocatechuate 3,4-dioxygenase beta subunit